MLAPYKYAGYPLLLEVLSSLNTPPPPGTQQQQQEANGHAGGAPPPAAAAAGGGALPGKTYFLAAEQVELTQVCVCACFSRSPFVFVGVRWLETCVGTARGVLRRVW